uniref:Translation initiation factor IF-2, chloroplastic n=1 Tax=Melanothamnus harveyi TaxID=397005 RepID=A0A1Z1MGU4_MELHR|nr:translation initiation factor 2 [Melanothamnus harveyi]ARW65290.1 translation initiation factor 2 [Melanothamnus harveyi]
MNILTLVFNRFEYKKLSFCCNHREYYDDILFLKSPKILKPVISDSHFPISVNDIIDNNNTKVLVSGKFDKKSKSSVISNDKDPIKIKKGKSKVNKNKHKVENYNVDKINTSDEDLFNNSPINKSSLKLRKSLLKDRKSKNKTSNTHNFTLNDLQVSNLNNLDSSYQLPKNILIDNALSVKDLSLQINVPEAEIIKYLFLTKGIPVTVNQILDIEICFDVVKHYGFNLLKSDPILLSSDTYKINNKKSSNSVERFPVITILGHVDHGKTTLLDCILKTSLVRNEQGGITQAIAGYEILSLHQSKEYKLTFLDTPGHESFQAMRVRGAKITDIVLLVIAIDDGLKPQTLESIRYIHEMSLSCIVVVTKADKSLDNLQRIQESLAQNNLLCEELGGEIVIVPVSALTGYNIDLLISKICSLAKSKKLYADPKEFASGSILDASLNQKQGPLATLIIRNGTLKLGDIVTSENLLGKVKNIVNYDGLKVKSIGPSSIAKVLCFSSLPRVGSCFYCFNNEKAAKKHIKKFVDTPSDNKSLQLLNSRIGFDNKFSRKQLNLIIKTDTQGSLEAIVNLFSTIPQSKVQINFIAASFGNITSSDLDLSVTSRSPILAFNVVILPQINNLIKRRQIDFKVFNVIYDIFDYVQNLMLDLVDTEYTNLPIGNAIVQSVFKNNKGNVAGCTVSSGRLKSSSYLKVYRNTKMIYEGFVVSLKFMKNDVEEVLSPSECGLMSDFHEWNQSDLIEVYEMVAKEKAL